MVTKREQRWLCLISDKINFKAKSVTRDKEGFYMKIKGSFYQKDIRIYIHIYAPNIRALQHTSKHQQN